MGCTRGSWLVIVVVATACLATSSALAQEGRRREQLPRVAPQRKATHQYQRQYTEEDFRRWARMAAPKRITSAQLDPDTGLLAWPRHLLRREYASERSALDDMFKQRADQGAAHERG